MWVSLAMGLLLSGRLKKTVEDYATYRPGKRGGPTLCLLEAVCRAMTADGDDRPELIFQKLQSAFPVMTLLVAAVLGHQRVSERTLGKRIGALKFAEIIALMDRLLDKTAFSAAGRSLW